jgi:ubiquinone/menaquinone biosynthesis C-methylase UbiE
MADLLKTTKEDAAKVRRLDDLSDFWEWQFSTTYELKGISFNTKKFFDNFIRNTKPGIMLDDGCGTGRVKKFFESKGWECYGIDVSSEALKIASKDTPLNLIHSGSKELPFKNEFFDLVIFWRVLHNIPKVSRKKSVKEIERVLKNKGKLICCVQSDLRQPTLSLYKKYGVEVDNDRGTYVVNQKVAGKKVQYLKRFYSRESITEEIEKGTDFKIKKITKLVEKSGLKAVNRQNQIYWVIEAFKQ